MLIRAGFDISIGCAQATPLLLLLNIHPSRDKDVRSSTGLRVTSGVVTSEHADMFGNRVHRVMGQPGTVRLTCDSLVQDTGLPDFMDAAARETPVADLPSEVLVYLLGSRYCETDQLGETAWKLFGNGPTGLARVEAICAFVHDHIAFDYAFAQATRTALGAYNDRQGVCRDFAHLAITLCRSMNIPARYCTGYLGDIGVPRDPAPMDFSAWFEVWLDGRWYTFDARHNHPRIGRIVMARGRDAADVAMISSFGLHTLLNFQVWTDQVAETAVASRLFLHNPMPAQVYPAQANPAVTGRSAVYG
ncbi:MULTISPECIES: transglutaminase family protein [unclassified Beijerinckia]|uniref:transglutaminase-like domain-containing protein n=1 Tax=unclassified Beijerinckia TaxID=2638183 RepID=UPI0008958E86|nr:MULTISPECIES: transglutaminase family protein [unclassified Beijerinckia]MDH7797752.1 transglutaminase-like putative cysteine protease [Beijerinckia sp. GAS462]SEC97397.1 Transglutaminase-like enzyme, putative cysteine protease [Beijerinckia sp. 28-YEA-48]